MDILSARFSSSPIYVQRSKGAWITDEQGKQYVDYLLGNCCHLLGHSHPRLVEAVREQISLCTNVGDHRYRLADTVAEKITALARKDAVRFVNSGSEAVHLAVRIARSYTARPKIIKFHGHYHGWFTEEISCFVPNLPYSDGLPQGSEQHTISLPWNDKSAVAAAMAEYGHQVACILCEPVLCHAGTVPPIDGFLAYLRQLADTNGTLLIFDECITGLRLAPGGAQELYNVTADLVTYSKSLSGGIPIGVCAGVNRVMEVLIHGRTYQAATYDANPISLAATNAVIDTILEEQPHNQINAYGEELIQALDELFSHFELPHIWQGFPAVFQFYVTQLAQIENHHQALADTDINFHCCFVDTLFIYGVNLFKGDFHPNPNSSWLSSWFVSSAHRTDELEWTIHAAEQSLQQIIRTEAHCTAIGN